MADQPLADNSIQETTGGFDDQSKRKKYIYGGVAVVLTIVLIIVIIVATTGSSSSSNGKLRRQNYPVMVGTWPAGNSMRSMDVGFNEMIDPTQGATSLNGVVTGVKQCQDTCGNNVGAKSKKSNIDSRGDITQAAMVIYGPTMESGSVANLYSQYDAVQVAYDVMLRTDHTLLVGDAAGIFAVQMGNENHNLRNNNTNKSYEDWRSEGCEPNFFKNIETTDWCDGPYTKKTGNLKNLTGCAGKEDDPTDWNNHDSIAMIAIDAFGDMSIATSSNGLNRKIAGRVSDAAIPGSGGYIDPKYGGCVATGHGDILLRFVPAKAAVTYMRMGQTAQKAAESAIAEIEEYCTKQAIVLCLDKDGNPGIANIDADNKANEFGYRDMSLNATIKADRNDPYGRK